MRDDLPIVDRLPEEVLDAHIVRWAAAAAAAVGAGHLGVAAGGRCGRGAKGQRELCEAQSWGSIASVIRFLEHANFRKCHDCP